MKKPNHPLAEIFGYPYDNLTPESHRHRKNRLCPFNNRVPSCTKDKANDPLGVCSIFDGQDVAITCPVRFREGWLIADDAAGFFFAPETKWTSLTEVRLSDRNGESAGNIDVVLVSYDAKGHITDFGALEVQAVYISGNVRRPFEKYMKSPKRNFKMDWRKEMHYPSADYLSSSRKRLLPQLIFKGGILQTWRKKVAVALHKAFFETLPDLEEVDRERAEIAWLIYSVEYNPGSKRFEMRKSRTVYTLFSPALMAITTPLAGSMDDFVEVLQSKLNGKLITAPTASTLLDAPEED